jgi:hypothetical protein
MNFKESVICVGLLASLTLASGCAGVAFSRNGPVSHEESRIALGYGDKLPEREPDRTNPDGSKTYVTADEWRWCGLTIWAVIPVPLWLPVCRDHGEVTYMNGVRVDQTTQWLRTDYALCGPFMPLMGIDGRPHGFCRTGH